MKVNQFSLHHLYIYFLNSWENLYYDLMSERVYRARNVFWLFSCTSVPLDNELCDLSLLKSTLIQTERLQGYQDLYFHKEVLP